MINKALALIVIFSLAFNIAFVGIWAYTRVRPAPPRPGPAPVRPTPPAPPTESLWQQLGLTPEQQRSVVEEWRQVGRQVDAKQAEVRQERVQLINLLQADVLDEQAVKATREKMDEDQRAVRELVFNRMLQLRQALNPDQRRRWLDVMLRTSEAAGGAKGPGPANGQPPGQQPGQMQPGQMQPGQMQPGQMQPGQMQPGQMQPGQNPGARGAMPGPRAGGP